jgi:hypothetical protein
MKLYIDGNVESSTPTANSSATSPLYTLEIGRRAYYNSQYFNGKIDQVRIFDSALDAAAVENLYNEKPEVNTSNFETVLYNGTSSDRYVSNVGFQPDLVWIKRRNSTNAAVIQDSVRGENNYLMPHLPNAQASNTSFDSFEANGFELTGSGGSWNNSTGTYVAWCWKGGGDALLNENGSINSQVSANQDAGFSIVKWTGDDSVNATIGHGLNSAPELYIIKKTSAPANWQANLASSVTGTEGYLTLDGAAAPPIYTTYPNYYTSANSTVLSTNGTTNAERLYNNQSEDYIAYCFHSVTGYQKIGSYTGGGSSGKTVTTGFRPRLVMIRRTDVSNYWVIIDSKRDTTDPYSKILWANVSDLEADGGSTTNISLSDTGFSMGTSVVGSSVNTAGGTYMYLAIA